MKLEYRLTGAGWAEAELYGTKDSVTVTASYLSDALGNLARGILAILRDTGEARFSFDEEPGEYRWIFSKIDPSKFKLTILEFDQLWGNKPDDEGKVIFDEDASAREFGVMALKTLENVLRDHGEKGYKKEWIEHDFPSQELHEIRKILKPNQTVEAIDTLRSAPGTDSSL